MLALFIIKVDFIPTRAWITLFTIYFIFWTIFSVIGWEQELFVCTQYILNNLEQMDITVEAPADIFKILFTKISQVAVPGNSAFMVIVVVLGFSFALATLSL